MAPAHVKSNDDRGAQRAQFLGLIGVSNARHLLNRCAYESRDGKKSTPTQGHESSNGVLLVVFAITAIECQHMRSNGSNIGGVNALATRVAAIGKITLRVHERAGSVRFRFRAVAKIKLPAAFDTDGDDSHRLASLFQFEKLQPASALRRTLCIFIHIVAAQLANQAPQLVQRVDDLLLLQA